ncbi:hypothetical protein B0I31_102762 [Saccharothrix carnea]|uniref:DUF1109 domain-containing protein n=1 Tax=Saccharothrix carnea TaxID=1280637 RepID=A0A2P8IH61_SACCR|nr:hypothetical protein [Saccharothrix carnea]PSL57783.1 hypothetical protein B0I31_102762 [Saccharothrix carnea]
MAGRISWWWSPWWTVVASLVPVTLALWSATPPGGYLGPWLLACGLTLLVITAWLIMAVVAVIVLPRPRLRHAVRLWPFLLVPALLGAGTMVVGSGSVPRAAFDAHRSSLEALATEVAPNQRVEDRRVGLFTVDVSADRPDGCTLLTVEDAGMFSTGGWAYCPDRVPVSAQGDGYKFATFEGPWYEYWFEW